ncbi:hypothetical protein [Streptomonospora litoralis]|uniref:Uncharacterized protein n=1 Tax=Streptomonospora litoralis TaxID=2498135 RepID=A0A4P6QA07_9ACTN|nr:hypothetical protein [Streptomonospora litoralis]QBI56184.1 hypothetical protein EKD16_22155 [Streptomonospora litoralis]
MLAAAPRRQRRPGFRAVLLSLLFVTHFFCAAGAMDTAAAAETEKTTAVSASATAVADIPASDGADEHHLCQADSSAGADQRPTAVAAAVLLGLGAGTSLLQAARSTAVLWRPSAFVAAAWSGARLLFSLGVQRV